MSVDTIGFRQAEDWVFNTILKIVATNSWMDMAISRFVSIAFILVV